MTAREQFLWLVYSTAIPCGVAVAGLIAAALHGPGYPSLFGWVLAVFVNTALYLVAWAARLVYLVSRNKNRRKAHE